MLLRKGPCLMLRPALPCPTPFAMASLVHTPRLNACAEQAQQCSSLHLPIFGDRMSSLFNRIARASVLAIGLAAGGGALAQNAICYNCPTEWADWGTQLRAIKDKTGVNIPADNKNS